MAPFTKTSGVRILHANILDASQGSERVTATSFKIIPEVVYFVQTLYMPIFIVRLGTPRKPAEGLRLGTVRRPPRGVPKADFARLDYYDVWFPNLSPSTDLVKEALGADRSALGSFRKKFRREMSEPDRSRELDVLAALSHQTNFSIGCYCEDETRCHRSVLRELLIERGASVV